MGHSKYAWSLKKQAAVFAGFVGFFAVRFVMAAGRFGTL
jgi:hypothetical protein